MKFSLKTIMEESLPEKNKKTGRMVCICIPKEVASKLQETVSNIDGDPIEIPDMHITLLLIQEGEDKDVIDTLNHMCQHLSRFKVSINEINTFSPTSYSDNSFVVYAQPHSSVFGPLHQKLKKFLHKKNIKADNGNFDFHPHITIKYCKEQKDLPKKVSYSFIVDHLALVDKTKKHVVRFKKGD